jgi:integrase/recombinase XerD
MKISDLAEEFYKHGHYMRNWSPRTIRTYRQGLNALSLSLNDCSDLTKPDLQKFVVWMRDRGLTPGGCNMYIRTVNSFLTWLNEEGLRTDASRIKLLPNPPKPLTTFVDADVRRIVSYRPKGRIELRQWTLVMLLLDSGLRIDEALGLERSRVHLDALTITVLGKGNKERIVPISVEGRKHLYKLTSSRCAPKSKYVFATFSGERINHRNAYNDIKSICRKMRVTGKHVHPHGFRHYFAVSYVRAGGDIYRLSRILGHASISTTQLYLRSMGMEHLQEGHSQFSPLCRA